MKAYAIRPIQWEEVRPGEFEARTIYGTIGYSARFPGAKEHAEEMHRRRIEQALMPLPSITQLDEKRDPLP